MSRRLRRWWGGGAAALVGAGARRAVALRRERCDDGEIPVGASKLGGLPDLPTGTAWPTMDGKPLAFLAQVALADVPEAAGEARLPRVGVLSFFLWVGGERWGFDPKDRGCWQVLYTPNAGGLVRTAAPEGAFTAAWGEEDEPFHACRVGFEVVMTYPELSDTVIDREDGEEIMELYDETVGEGQGDESPLHHLLGQPFVAQNPMETECQLVSNGVYCGSALSAADQKRADELAGGAKDWMLLLQLDSNDEPGWMWGDMGILYFWIRRQDLEGVEFSKGWGILQCG